MEKLIEKFADGSQLFKAFGEVSGTNLFKTVRDIRGTSGEVLRQDIRWHTTQKAAHSYLKPKKAA